MGARIEQELSLYRKAINEIDDRIEYSLQMPPESKAAIYKILDDLTLRLSEIGAHPIPYQITQAGRKELGK